MAWGRVADWEVDATCLVSGKINVSRQEYHVVVSEAHALAKKPRRRQTCTLMRSHDMTRRLQSRHAGWAGLTISDVGVESDHAQCVMLPTFAE